MTDSLDIAIIGAGIAGLSAALALSSTSQHNITIYEKSNFTNETGAAILIGPNGTKILRHYGFNFVAAGAVDYSRMRRFRADTAELESTEQFDVDKIETEYGSRWLMFHRADLHNGLRMLVEKRNNVNIKLGAAVKNIDPITGKVATANGESVQYNLLIVADGAHSQLISKVIGRDYPVLKSPMAMYRFLQPMSRILSSDLCAKYYAEQPPGFTTFYKNEVGRPGHMLNTYPCRGGHLLYAALLHPARPQEKDIDGWTNDTDAANVLEDSKGFHESVRAICEGATDVKVYKNMWRDPIETFVYGKAILIGDAAHLMLPTHGQGAAMAMEDAQALEVLFADASDGQVEERLRLFDKLRISRVSAVQTMSNKMMGPPDKMISEVKRYYDGPTPGVGAKTFSKEYNDFFFTYDVAEEAKALLR